MLAIRAPRHFGSAAEPEARLGRIADRPPACTIRQFRQRIRAESRRWPAGRAPHDYALEDGRGRRSSAQLPNAQTFTVDDFMQLARGQAEPPGNGSSVADSQRAQDSLKVGRGQFFRPRHAVNNRQNESKRPAPGSNAQNS